MAKKKVKRIKTGLAGAPLDKGYESVRFYFFTDLDKKDYVDLLKEYVKTNFSREEQRIILSNPDYAFNYFNYASMVHWKNSGFELSEYNTLALNRFILNLLDKGKPILEEKKEEQKEKPKVISPAERLKMKVQETIFGDIDILLDDWMDSKRTTIDIYSLVKKYDIKGVGLKYIEDRLQKIQDEYDGAYNKTCPQLVEAYNYLKRTDIKWFKEECGRMIADVQKLQAVRKAQRVPRAKKAVAADKQVSRLQYKVNDSEYKLESINPVLLVGATKVFVFNTKTRRISVYTSNNLEGISVSGTSLKNFSETSFTTTLRNPDETLKQILTYTPAKINKVLDELTTKRIAANGRINKDTILLKVLR